MAVFCGAERGAQPRALAVIIITCLVLGSTDSENRNLCCTIS